MSETLNKSQIVISDENVSILLHKFLELTHISTLGATYDSEVRSKRHLIFRLVENLAVGDISHQ